MSEQGVSQPNEQLIETIEQALEEHKTKPYYYEQFVIYPSSVEWLRALLEENKNLQQKLKDFEGCKGIEDYYSVQCALRETREELDTHRRHIRDKDLEIHRMEKELEQVKAEIAAYKGESI